MSAWIAFVLLSALGAGAAAKHIAGKPECEHGRKLVCAKCLGWP